MNRLSDRLALLAMLTLIVFAPAVSVPAQTAEDATPTEAADEDDNQPADPADNVFQPSEEIQADSEISFPSDI